MRRHTLVLLLSLFVGSFLGTVYSQEGPPRQAPTPSASPVDGAFVNRSGKPNWVLAYTPAAYHGQGCVVPAQSGVRGQPRSSGRSASYQPAWFQLRRHNTSGRLQRRVKVTHGSEDGVLRLYRLENGKEVFVEELVGRAHHSASSDVQPGGVLGFINISWPNEPKTPNGDYVARAVRPAAGTEVRFTLKRKQP